MGGGEQVERSRGWAGQTWGRPRSSRRALRRPAPTAPCGAVPRQTPRSGSAPRTGRDATRRSEVACRARHVRRWSRAEAASFRIDDVQETRHPGEVLGSSLEPANDRAGLLGGVAGAGGGKQLAGGHASTGRRASTTPICENVSSTPPVLAAFTPSSRPAVSILTPARSIRSRSASTSSPQPSGVIV